ncbi:hypothetical protein ABIE89_000538 [Bradyrhizobium niftali]|uniref:hypothetical protein n=1 Tax=Bradyrhizobium niftali TaxID=2560055 RepID=UPI003832B5D7
MFVVVHETFVSQIDYPIANAAQSFRDAVARKAAAAAALMQAYVGDYDCCRKHLKLEESPHFQFEFVGRQPLLHMLQSHHGGKRVQDPDKL